MLLGDEVLDLAELDNKSANQYLFVRHSHPVAFIQASMMACLISTLAVLTFAEKKSVCPKEQVPPGSHNSGSTATYSHWQI